MAAQLARRVPDGARAAIALSGGRDSVALLDAAIDAAAGGRYRLVAFHVHHGLSPNADAWSRFCSDLCESREVPFVARAIEVPRPRRTSLEAEARTARYDALRTLADRHDAAAVLLAHHADDQAETVLLQLLRGAGVRGLAAMPAARTDGRLQWLRPLLEIRRADIDAYVAVHRLRFVEDESNRSRRHRRNELRAAIAPALRAIAPGYPLALVRTAANLGEAAALLDDLAELDARSASDGCTLDRAAMRTLDGRRARNLLRWFLRRNGLGAPSSARLAEMLRQLLNAADDARVGVAHSGAQIGLHRGRISVHPPAPPSYSRDWTGSPTVELPHGTLALAPSASHGIAARHLEGARVTIRAGIPGERLHLAGRTAHRRVSDLLREAGVPEWDRAGLPRVYCGDALAAVACVGVDAAFAAIAGEPALKLDWSPHRAAR